MPFFVRLIGKLVGWWITAFRLLQGWQAETCKTRSGAGCAGASTPDGAHPLMFEMFCRSEDSDASQALQQVEGMF